MAKISHYYLSGSQSVANFALDYATIRLDGSDIQLYGSHDVDSVVVQRGFNFDFSNSNGGIDEIYLIGQLSDFTFAKSAQSIYVLASELS